MGLSLAITVHILLPHVLADERVLSRASFKISSHHPAQQTLVDCPRYRPALSRQGSLCGELCGVIDDLLPIAGRHALRPQRVFHEFRRGSSYQLAYPDAGNPGLHSTVKKPTLPRKMARCGSPYDRYMIAVTCFRACMATGPAPRVAERVEISEEDIESHA